MLQAANPYQCSNDVNGPLEAACPYLGATDALIMSTGERQALHRVVSGVLPVDRQRLANGLQYLIVLIDELY